MAMYRCAACGSSRVVTEQRQEQYYDTRKGLMGTMLMGSAGGLMGISTNTVTCYHCLACGQILSQPMNNQEKEMIDWYLEEPYRRSSFLKEEKEKYPNIEWEDCDSGITDISKQTSMGDERSPEKIESEKKQRIDIREITIKLLSGEVKKTLPELHKESGLICGQQFYASELRRMVMAGIIEQEMGDRKTYFALPGVLARIKEKERQQRLKEVKVYNKKINEQIATLREERERQYDIVSQNKYKFWGTGAQAKKDALSRVAEIDAEILELINQIKPEE